MIQKKILKKNVMDLMSLINSVQKLQKLRKKLQFYTKF
jgi:hypothetical protein